MEIGGGGGAGQCAASSEPRARGTRGGGIVYVHAFNCATSAIPRRVSASGSLPADPVAGIRSDLFGCGGGGGLFSLRDHLLLLT